jgi:hypothetical protein
LAGDCCPRSCKIGMDGSSAAAPLGTIGISRLVVRGLTNRPGYGRPLRDSPMSLARLPPNRRCCKGHDGGAGECEGVPPNVDNGLTGAAATNTHDLMPLRAARGGEMASPVTSPPPRGSRPEGLAGPQRLHRRSNPRTHHIRHAGRPQQRASRSRCPKG